MGRRVYEKATELLITADAGGSNGCQLRRSRLELQKFAERTGLTIGVSLPTRYFEVEQDRASDVLHITETWRSRLDHETVVQLIGATRTTAGLHIKAKLDRRTYPTGRRPT